VVADFARLKWTLTTGRLRTARTQTRVATAIGLVAGLLVSGLVAAGLIALRPRPDLAAPAIGAVFTLQLLSWTLAPLIAFGIDETVDPRRFALLPLRPGTLQRGLLVSSLIGYLPVFNAVVLLGAAIGLSASASVFPLALLCCAVQLVTCVVFSRAAATSMAALMSSRRGRDLGMAVGIGVIVAYLAGSILLNSNTGARGGVGTGALTVAGALQWGPPGSLAVLPVAAAAGEGTRLLIAAGTAAVFLALGWWWWSAALRRSLTTVPSTTAGSTPARAGDLGHAVADGVRGMALLVAARDARLAWRDPMRRLPWVLVVLFCVGWPFVLRDTPAGVYGVVLGSLLVGAQTANHLGVEGSGLWLHLVAFSDRTRARGEMLGHSLASFVPGVLIIAVGLAVQAVVRHEVPLLPAAAGLCLSALLGALGGACWMSAALPFAMPQSRTSVFASSIPGQKGRSSAASLGVLAIGVATALPAVAAAVAALTVDPAWGWGGLAGGLLTGSVVFTVLVRLAADRYVARGPEILAVVSIGDRS
jgi:ABC-2 type transport system permease protein